MNFARAILYVALAVAAGISIATAFTDRFPGDLWVSRRFQEVMSPPLTAYMKAWSRSGNAQYLAPVVTVLAMGILVARGHVSLVWLPPLAAVFYLVAPALKVLVGRPRPSPEDVQVLYHGTSNSFPSGHAFCAALVLGCVIYLAPRLFGPHRPVVLAVRVLLGAAILMIAAAQLYLGAHWMSDLLGGLLLGALTLYAVMRAYHLAAARLRVLSGPESPKGGRELE